MFKFLLIIGITIYILYKVGSFLFKIGAASQQFRNNQPGNIPGNDPRKSKKKPNITGEYVDYEDVK
ncbi:MAG TPA: hypothetical protein VFO54_11485 [Chryseosolibacter sp.]|nr:hypothetical protein [Chryseosolibacter sp.]